MARGPLIATASGCFLVSNSKVVTAFLPSLLRRIVPALCLALSLSSVKTGAQTTEPPPKAIPVQATTANYRIAANDVVKVSVFQEEDLETLARVAQDGKISVPYIGSVDLAGRTLQEGARSIEARLREYYKHPQVVLRVMEYSKRNFTVLGQVSRPGIYDLPNESSLNLIEAIGVAGGYTRIANPGKITIKRQDKNGKETMLKVDAKKMATDSKEPRLKIEPGDTINVSESWL